LNVLSFTGITGAGTNFAVTGYSIASPRNFSSGGLIDNSATFVGFSPYTPFRVNSSSSPDFASGSYIGFRSANNHYGWLEVTWSSASDTFEILSGAYESTAGMGISAGATSAIPEPTAAVMSLGALAAGACIRRRKQAA
jgi:hypothetical protein